MLTAPGDVEFDRLLDCLARDIVDAAIFRKLRSDLTASYGDYWREFGQSPAFWSLSFQSYIEAALNRLIRIYVGHPDALSLDSWLREIKKRPQLLPRRFDPVQLDKDLLSVSVKHDPIVKNLAKLRNNILAHINWDNVAKDLRLLEKYAPSYTEVDALVSRALDILNRYSILFKGSAWSPVISGHDDFRAILDALRADLARKDAERAAGA
jgi:hypothetical protein